MNIFHQVANTKLETDSYPRQQLTAG